MTASALTRLTGAGSGRSPARTDVHVVALPHSGAAATAFTELARVVGSRATTWGATLPGRGPRASEPLPTRWEPEVTALCDEIAASVPDDSSLVLVGQSLGGVLAYDLTRRLRDAGRHVAHLVVAARSAPHLGGPLALPADDAELAEVVSSRYGSIPPAVLAEPELLAYFIPVLRADLIFNGTYRHRDAPPLDVPITAMVGDADRTIPRAALLAWGDHTTAAFRPVVVAGGHLCLAGNESVVASCLDDALEARPAV